MARYGPAVRRYVHRYADGPDEAAELYQRVWVEAYLHRKDLQGDGSPRGWLLAITRTVCGRFARAKRRVVRLGDAIFDVRDVALPPDRRIALARAITLIESLIAGLPPRQRQVVEYRVLAGLSTSETAIAMGCGAGTVKATLHAALARLRQDPRSALLRRLLR